MAFFKTSNGIDVNVIKDSKFTGNIIILYFISPLDDKVSENALLAKVLKNSNNKFRTVTELNSFLELNYGASLNVSISKKAESQIIKFSVSFIKDKYTLNGELISENMGDLLYNVIRNPMISDGRFSESVVEVEKTNLKNAILSRVNNKRSYAIFRCKEEMCKNEAYGKDEFGKIDVIDKITSEQLYDHYKYFVNNSKIFIQFIGDFSDEFAEKLTDRIFYEPVNSGTPNPVYIIKSAHNVREFEENFNVNQSVLVMGYRTGIDYVEQDKYSYMLLNSVLGGGTASLLFKNVREKLSLCYFCASITDRLKGILLVYSGISNENKDKTVRAVKEQIEILKSGDITDKDIEAAKADIINQYNQVNDSLSSIAEYYFGCFFVGTELSVEEQIQNIKKVTLSDIIKVSEKLSLDTVYFLTGMSEGAGGNE